jgi:hypothetical protein
LRVGDGGDLSRAADTRALAEHATDSAGRREVDLDEFWSFRFGGSWTSAGLVEVGHAINLAKWEASDRATTLLRDGSVADLERITVTGGNDGRFGLSQEARV